MPSKAVIYTALARVFTEKAKEARKELGEGEHRVEATVMVNLQGVLRVEADKDYTPTTSIPHKATLALFMRYAGITGPQAMRALVRAVSESMEIGLMGKEAREARIAAIREVADLDAAEETVRRSLGELPKATRNGAVYSKVQAGEVRVVGSL